MVSVLCMGHHPLAHKLHPETLAAYQAQVPMHPDVIVWQLMVSHRQRTERADGFGVYVGFLVVMDGILHMELK